MKSSPVKDWDDELTRYRMNVSSKRASVAPPPLPVQPMYTPSYVVPLDIEYEEELEGPEELNLDVDIDDSASLTGSLPHLRSPTVTEINSDDDDDDEVPMEWVEYRSVKDINKSVFYNDTTRQFATDSNGVNIVGASVPSSPPTLIGESEQERKLHSLEVITKYLEIISRNTDLCDTQTELLGPEFGESVTKLKAALTAFKNTVDKIDEDVNVEGNVVHYLVGWRHLRWNFNDNDAVNYYRACSTLTDHKSLTYSKWHFPEYFSNNPLPPNSSKVNVKINLPKHLHNNMQQTSVSVSADENVSAIFQRIALKLGEAAPQSTEWVLKVTGQRDYLDESKPFFSYAHVRKCVRDSDDAVELTMVKRPEPNISVEAQNRAEHAMVQYQEQIDSNIHIIDKFTYSELSGMSSLDYHELRQLTHLPVSSINIPFQVKVIGIENINANTLPRLKSNITHVSLRAQLFHGTTGLSWNHETPINTISETLLYNHRFLGNHSSVYSLLPREARVGYLLVGRKADSGKEVLLGWVCQQLIDYKGELATGRQTFHLWAFPLKEGKKHGKKRDADPHFLFRASTLNNNTVGIEKAVLHVEYPSFGLPVVAPLASPYIEPNVRVVGSEMKQRLDVNQSQILAKILNADPLVELNTATKTVIWNIRHHLTDIPNMLPKILRCVNWGLQDYRNEAYRLLKCWSLPVNPIDAIELLDARYPDYRVREYAVNILRGLTDEDLQMFLLQLVQCVKFEPYHDSPLSRFLIERAIKNPYQIAHTLYWHLKAEVHDPLVCERFALLLEELISNVGIFIDELHKQSSVVLKLQKVAEMVVKLKRELKYTDADATVEYHRELENLNKTFFEPMGKFQIPLNPKLEATTLMVEKCKYMSSKMVPLWLVFKNADEHGAPIYIIFKSGDDLRQDLLTLQLLRVMDKLWLQQGLDMRLKPYSCIATGVNDEGEGVGMIEVVMNSDTTSGIQLKYGGGAMGALKLDPLDLFIRENNRDEPKYCRAVYNFINSCAGYCVATYVLGIGDRHNGNIMLTKTGHLFHIDFGHFLGNFKSKFGINRERAAFVFTPEMAFVMGGKEYKKHKHFLNFKKQCTKSFNVLRANAALLESLFLVMVAAGMPELMKETDILYLREMLHLDKDSKTATKSLQDELKRSLDSTYRRFDNYIHNLRHG